MSRVGVAVALLVLPNGNLVLQRRSQDASVSPGKLGFFGGHIEANESPDEAIVRELAEEISLPVAFDSMKRRGNYLLPETISGGRHITFHVYEARVPSVDFEVFEGEAAEVYTPEAVLKRSDASQSTKYIIKKVSTLWH